MTTDVYLSGILLSLLIVTVNSVLGILVLSRNPKKPVNRIFILLTIALSLWATASIVSDSTSNYELSKITSQLAFGFSYLVFVLIWLFSSVLSHSKLKLSYPSIAVLSILSAIIFSTPLVYNLTSISSSETGYLYLVYVVVSLMLITGSIINFIKLIKKGTSIEKSQSRVILFGFGLLSLLAFLTNAILPRLLDVNPDSLTKIGPSLTLILASVIAYAMIRHRLFDIRLLVVRTMGYILAIVLIGFLSFESLLALNYLIEQRNLPESFQASILVFVSLLLAISFTPFKKFFDKVTAKLFYRDAYETQELLNEFNKAIVSTIDADQLLPRAGAVIEKYLKPDWVAFAIRDSEQDQVRVISEGTKKIFTKDVENLRPFVKEGSDKIIVTDLIESNNDLKERLQNDDIGILSRITSDLSVEGSGYVIMGYKKSGNMYNSQDLGALEILSNELAIAIQNALQFEEIQKFNITLQDKVDEATKELKKSNEKLKQLDETKDEFISMASHQLRTPLTSVKGYLSMVIEGDAGELSEMQKKLLDQAFISSQRMVYLIADLLNVSRLRTGKFIIDSNEVNLSDTVEGEVSQLVETAKSRGLELKYNKPKEFPVLILDETKIRQVIMNFIDNAIYYTPKGGHIEVSLAEVGDSVELRVTDDGLGVPKHEQHNLFSKFFRANNAKKARPDGTGLGLFMAKKVIVTQGGAIIFSSEENKGSTFGFSFSKAKLSPPKINSKK
jgi:signal transduction histidine kinase